MASMILKMRAPRVTMMRSMQYVHQYHVVLGGGGIMGCSSGYFLTQHGIPPHEVCIVERDPTYSRASTVLSVGSIRQQFSLHGNILLSLHSSQFLRNSLADLTVDEIPDIQFVEGGYLFLASEDGKDILYSNHCLQRSLGADIELMTPQQLKARFPWLNTDNLALGAFGVRGEGWFDPWSLLNSFKKKLIALGVHFIHGNITSLSVHDNKVQSAQVQLNTDEQVELKCNYFVNTAGPQSANLAKMAGIGDDHHPNSVMKIPLPVRPRKRCVFVLHCPTGPTDCPLLVDITGFYVRRESQEGTFICGLSPPASEDYEVDDLEVDYNYFEEKIWPHLAQRIPAFEAIKVKGGWAGFYEYNTFDQNGIIGCHPVISNFVFATGFSGHGIQQSPAVGRAVSEIITKGQSTSIDISDFGFERIVNKTKFLERNIV